MELTGLLAHHSRRSQRRQVGPAFNGLQCPEHRPMTDVFGCSSAANQTISWKHVFQDIASHCKPLASHCKPLQVPHFKPHVASHCKLQQRLFGWTRRPAPAMASSLRSLVPKSTTAWCVEWRRTSASRKDADRRLPHWCFHRSLKQTRKRIVVCASICSAPLLWHQSLDMFLSWDLFCLRYISHFDLQLNAILSSKLHIA